MSLEDSQEKFSSPVAMTTDESDHKIAAGSSMNESHEEKGHSSW